MSQHHTERESQIVPSTPEYSHLPDSLRLEHVPGKGWGLFAERDIAENERIFTFEGEVKNGTEASTFALQVGEDQFLDSTVGFDNYLNHDCEPNGHIMFDETGVWLRARRPIAKNEELSFHYHTTEWDMLEQNEAMGETCTFECRCGAVNCHRHITGFAHLSPEQQLEILPMASPYIREKFATTRYHLR